MATHIIVEQAALLEKKRKALEEIINITRSVDRLKGALESTLLLRKPIDDSSQSLYTIYERLESTYKEQPNNRIKFILNGLDKMISEKISVILRLADDVESRTPEAHAKAKDVEEISRLVNEFNRLTQTAIALRVLLKRRGVRTDSIILKVPEKAISSRISLLSTKEELCREDVRRTITSIAESIDQILASSSRSEKLVKMLISVKADLMANLEHLASGKNIDSLPMPVEALEMVSSGPISTPAPTHGTARTPKQIEVERTMSLMPTETRRPREKLGFFAHLRLWLSTPWSVRWKDIEVH